MQPWLPKMAQDCRNPFRRRVGMVLFLPRVAKQQVVGIMNSQRFTKGNFNSPRVAKPQVVGIEIDLSDKWRIHHCLIVSKNLVCGTTNRNFPIIWRNWRAKTNTYYQREITLRDSLQKCITLHKARSLYLRGWCRMLVEIELLPWGDPKGSQVCPRTLKRFRSTPI